MLNPDTNARKEKKPKKKKKNQKRKSANKKEKKGKKEEKKEKRHQKGCTDVPVEQVVFVPQVHVCGYGRPVIMQRQFSLDK